MLWGIGGRLSQRVDGLLGEVRRLPSVGTFEIKERRQVEHIVYQMQNCWESFVREMILCSATGYYSNRYGPVKSSLSSKITSKEQAAAVLVSLYPRRRFEPDWYLSREAIDAATRLQLSNLPDITAVLGATPWPLDDLRSVRNFFAHRSKRAAKEVRALSWFNSAQSITIENTCFDFDMTGNRRIESWGAFMKLAANQLI